MYRLLALDLDGTLVEDGKPIPPEVKDALAKVAERGVIITIASGRMYQAALPFAKALNLNLPIIAYQGAMVRHAATNEIIYHQPLPYHLGLEFLHEIQSRGHHINLYLNDTLYIAERTPEAREYERLAGVQAEVVGDLLQFYIAQKHPPTKILAITSPQIAPKLLEEMQTLFNPHLYITRSYPTFTEALNPACNKGKALAALAASLNIEREAVIAIGDNLNDLPMIEWAGLGVAVANASDALKAQADYVTGAELSAGVLEVISKFLLS